MRREYRPAEHVIAMLQRALGDDNPADADAVLVAAFMGRFRGG